MEVLLHFTIPFIMLTQLGLKPKKALALGVLAILPDLDVLFLVHRSLSHSLFVLGLAALPFFIYSWKFKPRLLRTVWLGFITVLSHIILDLFNGYTPILWPLYLHSLSVNAGLNGNIGSGVALHPTLQVYQTPTVFHRQAVFDAPLFKSSGLVVSLILIAPVLYRLFIMKRLQHIIASVERISRFEKYIE